MDVSTAFGNKSYPYHLQKSVEMTNYFDHTP